MMKTILLIGVCAVLFTACSQIEEENIRIPEVGEVSFSGSVSASSRATNNAFDRDDQISVFAFKNATGFQMESIYATNKKYSYTNQFTAIDANNAIVYPEDEGALSFQAIYPYAETVGASFTFNVKEDQSVEGNYTQSDLMTASTIATTDLIPHLKFGHRLTNVVVNLTFDQTPAGIIKVEFQQVATAATVDMVAATFKSTGDQTKVVRAASRATNSYQAILPPQTIEADATLAVITTEAGDAYTCKIPKKETWKSGIQYVYNLHIGEKGDVTFTSEIDPWGEPEEPPVVAGKQIKRMVDVIGADVLTSDFSYDAQGRLSEYTIPSLDADIGLFRVRFSYGENEISAVTSLDETVYETVTYSLNEEENISKMTVVGGGGGRTIIVNLSYDQGYLTSLTNNVSVQLFWNEGLLQNITDGMGGEYAYEYNSYDAYKEPFSLSLLWITNMSEVLFGPEFTAAYTSALYLDKLGKSSRALAYKVTSTGITILNQYQKDADGYVWNTISQFTILDGTGTTEEENMTFYY